MGVGRLYSSECGYQAEVYEGGGFHVTKILQLCRSCDELVGVAVGFGGRELHDPSRGELPLLLVCPECGSDDVVDPPRVGARSRVACPRCGEAMKAGLTAIED